MKNDAAFIDDWQILDSELWDRDALDLVVPAHLRLDENGGGYIELIAIQADVDYRITVRDGSPAIEFSWHGDDDGEETNGRGWAVLANNQLRGRFFIHRGDDSSFLAERAPTGETNSAARRKRSTKRTARR